MCVGCIHLVEPFAVKVIKKYCTIWCYTDNTRYTLFWHAYIAENMNDFMMVLTRHLPSDSYVIFVAMTSLDYSEKETKGVESK